ncbi:MAG: hypothetical protein Q4F34_07685, partial [Prevotellaceae bacterium]|nr:hypothetical protein [Prevotellaceae bacterium]
MRGIYRQLAISISLLISATAANAAPTPIKNLYLYAQAYPSGAGTVYVAPKDKDKDYVKEQSAGFGETAILKYTTRENGGADDAKAQGGDCQQGVAMYEALISAKANDGYEFVGLAPDAWNGTFTAKDVYAVHTGDDGNSYKFSFDYTGIENGLAINANNPRHDNDGDDDSGKDEVGEAGKGQPYVFSHGKWADTPDTYIYAIFRKKGEQTPKIDLNGEETKAPFIAAQANEDDRISLDSYDGQQWQIFPMTTENKVAARESDYTPEDYVDGIVPGTVFAAYVAAGREKDPNYADNVYQIEESKYSKPYWYRTMFDRPEMIDGQHIQLVLEGTNRSTVVYLNGKKLGNIEGHVLKKRYDVTSMLKDKDNVLSILVYPFNDKFVPKSASFVNYVLPTYVASHSWDWMPYVPGLNCGVTNDVYLETVGGITLRDPWVRTAELAADHSSAKLATSASLVNLTSTNKEVQVKATIMPGNLVLTKNVTVNAGDSIDVELGDLTVNNPNLWWPNGYGKQNMYDCQFEVIADGIVIDSESTKFGIRKYDYKKENTALVVYCNGEKIYCKGGNWGMSDYMLRLAREGYDKRIRLHQDMNYTMIRLWTGCVTDEELYDACDKYGIMIWDDFWLTGPYVGLTGPDDVNTFMTNVKDKVARLRNHPSIAVWCGDNEGWPYDELNNYINTTISTFDAADRVYIPNSHNGYFTAALNDSKDGLGWGLSGSGWWSSFPPENYFKDGIQGGGGDRGDISDWGFRSELGTGAFCTYESLREFMPINKLWPRNDMWDKHFFSDAAEYGGAASASSYFDHVKKSYGESSNAKQFCERAQLYNIEVMKAAYEGWNYHLWNTATGLLYWMSHPAYPSLLWQTYDYYMDMTGTYWGAKKGCEPVHIQWNCYNNDITVVNTTLNKVEGYRAEVNVYDINGVKNTSVSGKAENINVEKNKVANVFNLNTSSSKPLSAMNGVFILKLALYDNAGNLVSENTYWKTTKGSEKDDYTALNTIPQADVACDFSIAETEGTTVKATATLTNNSTT